MSVSLQKPAHKTLEEVREQTVVQRKALETKLNLNGRGRRQQWKLLTEYESGHQS